MSATDFADFHGSGQRAKRITHIRVIRVNPWQKPRQRHATQALRTNSDFRPIWPMPSIRQSMS